MLRITMIWFFTSVFALAAWAHGEDKPGPNQGYIQMPANFHTELVPGQKGQLRIYLLDLQFKNPTTVQSSVQVTVIQGKKSQVLKCSENNDHYLCTGAPNLTSGLITIKAKRLGTEASIPAQYELPLKPFEKTSPKPVTPAAQAEDHSNH